MNKYQEALNTILMFSGRTYIGKEIDILQELVDNHEKEVQVLKATIQNKNSVINSLSKKRINNQTMYGYNVEELYTISRLLIENKIDPKILHDSTECLKRGYQIAQEEMDKQQKDFIDKLNGDF